MVPRSALPKIVRHHLRHAQWRLSPRRRAADGVLASLRGVHGGRRCWVWGNGPSLGRMDLSPLRRELTVGLNRGYLLFDRLGWATTYHVTVNALVLEQFGADIEALPDTCTRLVSWPGRHAVPSAAALRCVPDAVGFSADPRQGLYIGATVTHVALQLAYWLGCDPVVLIGVDHRFTTPGDGKANQTLTSGGDDANHFDPSYFGKGTRWQLPDLETSEAAYRLAREAFEADGRRVLDATVDGALRVFEKADYNQLIHSQGS